ncbi:MAG TPA: TlyA family rRNA (cytidine-2'-O)-methyltransferase [Clostridiales bacterium UBA8153]|nr:TlyA family rRNA (cytidine-2'-O)-methyltransferase [Clostridiales bacterium UBA8153]
MRRRLDQALVERGLAGSLQEAAGLILAGRVFSGDRRLDKLGTMVRPEGPLRVRGLLPYVGRGGEKLAAALEAFTVRVAGRVALDCGAAAGGFTDCLLQAGARLVYAVDVGRGQLHWRLVRDPRVRDLGGTNLSNVGTLVPPPGLLTLDLSYLSLRVAVPAAVRILDPTDPLPEIIALVKPLFELRTNRIPSGPAAYRQVLTGLVEAFMPAALPVHGLMRSPLPGRSGTVEFFLHLRPGVPPALEGQLEAALAQL